MKTHNKSIQAIIVIIVCASITMPTHNAFTGESSVSLIGIVTASKLACRDKPDLKAAVKLYYSYGTPVRLSAKSDTPTAVGDLTDFWYRDDRSDTEKFSPYQRKRQLAGKNGVLRVKLFNQLGQD